MLARANRLKKNHEITRVYRRGLYGSGHGRLSVKALANHLAYSRGVVVVSKKIDKRAVVRNTIRRRLAAVLAAEWGTVTPGYDIVITVHADVHQLPTPLLRESLQQALTRAKVRLGNV